MLNAELNNSLPVGAYVRLKQPMAYLKTAVAMPMLRPGDLVQVEEQGTVVAIHPLQQRAVRFRRGTFLLTLADLEECCSEQETAATELPIESDSVGDHSN
jgi:hypothetical protein